MSNSFNPDTNCNDIIEMSITVNGYTYFHRDKLINTQNEWKQFQSELITIINNLELVDISRFKV